MMNVDFSKEDSFAVKGIAICMMMWHHCFLSGRFTGYTISFYPLIERQVVNIATFFKMCVSLFAFVSGYGLYVSFYRFRNKGKSQVQEWIKRDTVKLLNHISLLFF